MRSSLLGIAAALSNEDLLQRVKLLAGREREATVELVAHLAELDKRKLHLAQGYGSLFGYCTEALHLAEHAAYNRIEAARASRRFPVILDRLADGSLNLSTVRLLVPLLTPENHRSLLAEARWKSKREVEALVAQLYPRPDVPASIRKLPPPRWTSLAPVTLAAPAAAPAAAAPATLTAPATSPTDAPPVPAPCTTPAILTACAVAGTEPTLPDAAASPGVRTGGTPVAPPVILPNRPVVVPLAPERYRVQFTVGRQTHENLRRVQDLLRREIPSGDPGAIFDRALKVLLEDIARKKLAATSKPRPSPAPAGRSRHIPAHMKRAVWLRDGGQCAFVGKSGRRCRERAFLEFHHVEPYALGGETTAPNLRLHCRAHNVLEAEPLFGVFPPVEDRVGDLGSAGRDLRLGQASAGPRGRGVARPGG